MLCPSCGHDNIAGADECEGCGSTLTEIDPSSEFEQSLARHSIDVLPTKPARAVAPHTSVREAVGLLVAEGIGCLLVEEGGKLVGVFTERDVLNRVSGDLDQTWDAHVNIFMTSAPVTVKKHDSIAYVLHAMDVGGYRHMPIVDDAGSVVGVISVRDILRYLCIKYGELRAETA
jgi:CBS domain-containing protein